MGFTSDLKILYHLALKPVRGKDHAARMESFYSGQAEAYDDFRKRLLKGRQELWNLIQPPEGGTWIDMGGGTEKTFPFLLGPNPDPTCQGPDCTSSFGGSRPPVPIPPTRRRVYWYVDKHDN